MSAILSAAPALHGIRNQVSTHDRLDEQVEELRVQGFTTVASGLSEAQLADLRGRLEAVYATQVDEVGGLDALRRCSDLDTARCPLVYDDAFVAMAANAPLMALVRRVLGENFVLLQQNGLLNRPGSEHYQVHWHRDLAYQHWTSSEPIAINALLTLDPFTVDNGATHVLPASHLRTEFPSDSFVARHERPVEAPAGTFLVLDAMLYHRAGRNRSAGQRRAVNHLIGRPFMAQQFDLPSLLDERHARDPFLAKYLGWRWAPCRSVADWRRQRGA